MNSEVVVFLDTSIQIERVIGNKTRQAQIEQELKNPARHFVTSSYVFMEFQRSLWADFIYVYNLMQQQTDWQTIAKVNPRSIKEQARVERLLAAVITEPRAALGQAACWPLGDVIIALQVPANASLWTLDVDFQPLAEALGVRL